MDPYWNCAISYQTYIIAVSHACRVLPSRRAYAHVRETAMHACPYSFPSLLTSPFKLPVDWRRAIVTPVAKAPLTTDPALLRLLFAMSLKLLP